MSMQDDLLDAAIVNSLLGSSQSPAKAAPPSEHYQKKQKNELIYLRQHAADLTMYLETLTNVKSLEVQQSGNYWERVARNQKMASERAALENARLKRALEDQLELAAALDKVLVKRPRLAAIPSMDMADWKFRRLPADPARRTAAFHALVDDACSNTETMFVRSGILDAPVGHRSLGVAEVDDSILVSIRSVVTVPSDVQTSSNKIWTVWASTPKDTPHHVRIEHLETFGADGVYARMTVSLEAGMPCMLLMYAIKRYIYQDRILIVQKSILDDEKYPPPPNLVVGNYCASIVVQAVGPNESCRRVCVEGKLPAQPPRGSPLYQEELRVSDAVLKMARPVIDTLEALFNDDGLDDAIMDSILDPPVRPNYQVRQKHELAFLRDEATTLASHLGILDSMKTVELEHCAFSWEKVARTQKLALDKALLENARLKRALAEHVDFTNTLQHVFVKRPRTAGAPTIHLVDWKLRRLPMDHDRRVAAFHGMMDDAYANLETLYVRTGILEASSGEHSVTVASTLDSVRVTMTSVADVSKDYQACSDSVWSFYRADRRDALPHASKKMVETFGDDGMYFHMTVTLVDDAPCTHLMFALKRYSEMDRDIFVLKTFLEDETHAPPSSVILGNHTASIIVQTIEGNRTCRRFCAEGLFPPMAAATDLVVELTSETPQRRYRQRQKRELAFLRDKVAQMTAHLAVVESLRSLEADRGSHWEKVARAQKLGCRKSQTENARLRRALQEQLQIADLLRQILTRRPTLAAFPTMDMVDSKLRRLPIEHDARRASFLAIMADVYDRVDATLLRRGLLDAPIGHRSFKVQPSPGDASMSIDIQYVTRLHTNYLDAALHFWSVWTRPAGQHIEATFTSQIVERFGDDTVYMEQFDTFRGAKPYLRRLCGMQKFVEPNRVVFVMRTVLEDAKLPPVEGLYIANDAATIVFERATETTAVRRISLGGELPVQPPPMSPLGNNSEDLICDFILHEAMEAMWGTPMDTDTTSLVDLILYPTLNTYESGSATSDERSVATTRKSSDDDEDGAGSTAQQRYRKRQRRELDYLHEQVVEMSAHLEILKNIRGMENEQSSYWEKKARLQKLGCQKSAQENARLKKAIEEQLKIAETLNQLLVKRPRLASFPTMDMVNWKLRRLPLDTTGRHACLRAILSDAYERVDTMLLRHGLFDAPNGHKTFNVNATGNAIEMHVQAVHILPSHFLAVAMQLWSLWSDPSHTAFQSLFKSRVLETLGDDTIYAEQIETLRGAVPYMYRLSVLKRFVEDDRVVFVITTILDDAKYPPPKDQYISNDQLTLVIERVNESQSIRRLCLRGELPIAPPMGNPLTANPQHLICDFILHRMTHTFNELEKIFS
ncbi:hypothetical protein ACHHYP_14050 [Achlya hypogyna]|uniref:START domain-containing protein n=1 Tax=Achlya hypogyna TaxID=1202772 RepID=A0A1V9YE11_ACHHY|nr:hypothetical protein ACHHYP_14050 [Achlya hypogyna]